MNIAPVSSPLSLVPPTLGASFPRIHEVPLDSSPLKHFEVDLLNREGKALSPSRIYSFDCRCRGPSTLLVTLLSTSAGGRILVKDEPSAFLAARGAILSQDPCPSLTHYRSIAPAAFHDSSSACLGGNFFPSVGGSMEWCSLFVRKGAESETTTGGRFISLQDIATGYQSGSTHDLRLLLAAFRSARVLGESLSLATRLSSSTRENTSPGNIPIASHEKVKDWIRSMPEEDRVAFVSMKECQTPRKPFLSAAQVAVQLAPESTLQELTLMQRKGNDAVDVAAYTFINGRVHLLVKREIRPALALPDLLTGKPSSLLRATSLGGVAESLEGELTLQEIGERGAQGVREEAGCEPAGPAQYFGFSYTSPATALERAYHFAVEVDPRVKSSFTPDIDEVVDLAYLDIEDVIALADEGIIQDPRLELSAHLLKASQY